MTDTKHPAPTKPGTYWAKNGEGWAFMDVVDDGDGNMCYDVFNGNFDTVVVGSKADRLTWGPRIPEPEELEAMERVCEAAWDALAYKGTKREELAATKLESCANDLYMIRKGGR